MRIVNKSYKTVVTLWLCLCVAGVIFQSCKKDEEFRLDAFGPSKVERCGEIYFIGSGLDQVEKIILPADDWGWAIERSEFISPSSGKITVQVPCAYPFDQKGPVKVIYSGGKEYITSTTFIVLNEVSVIDVTVGGAKYAGETLDVGTEVTIRGRALALVDSLIFGEGIGTDDFRRGGDSIIVFNFPDYVPNGSLMQLKVPARNDWTTDSYVDICEVFVIGPSVKGFAPNGGVNVPLCSPLEILVNRIDRVQIDKDGYTDVTFGTVTVKGKVDAANGKIVVDLNRVSFYEAHSVSLISLGKTYLSETQTFTIATPTIDNYVIRNATNCASASAYMNFDIEVLGKNLCSVKNVKFELSSGGEGIASASDPSSGSFKASIAVRYKKGSNLMVVFESGDEIELEIDPCN